MALNGTECHAVAGCQVVPQFYGLPMVCNTYHCGMYYIPLWYVLHTMGISYCVPLVSSGARSCHPVPLPSRPKYSEQDRDVARPSGLQPTFRCPVPLLAAGAARHGMLEAFHAIALPGGTWNCHSRSATARELMEPGVACCLGARCAPHSPCVAARRSTRRSSRDARSMDCGRRRTCLGACTVKWKRLYLKYAPSRFRPNFAHSWTRNMSRHDVIEKRRQS